MRCGDKKKRGKRRGKENSARKVCAGKKENSVGNSKKQQAALFGAERKNAWSDDVMDLNSFGIWNLIIIIE